MKLPILEGAEISCEIPISNKVFLVDPEFANQIHRNNTFRVKRALEIFLSSGKRKSEFLDEQRRKFEENNGFKLRFPKTLVKFH